MAVTVTSKEELEKAIKAKEDEIYIANEELVEKICTVQKLKKYSPAVLAILGAAIAAIPFTGGVSGLAVSGVMAATATTTGVSVAVISSVIFFGFALVLLLINQYDYIEFETEAGFETKGHPQGKAKAKIILKRKN